MIKIALLGSTGSIGKQVLSVVSRHADKYKIVTLAANRNARLFAEQVNEFRPIAACLSDSAAFDALRAQLPENIEYFSGDGALENAVIDEADVVFCAVSGFAGLKSVLKAVNMKKNVALANKETLVAGGALVMRLARENGVKIIPVDSEHSALWQCLDFDDSRKYRKLILTASGGPFLNTDVKELDFVTPEQALKHPNWSMGSKITVDCSTMMNKGLEVLEAHWLFGAPAESIDTVIHPQSIIHSMVEFCDGSVIAQMGPKSMELPIQLALSYPERLETGAEPLDFARISKLEFFELDREKFPCFGLALEALKRGGNSPCAMSAANEAAVELFLEHKIKYTEIAEYISFAMGKISFDCDITYDKLALCDGEAKKLVFDKYNGRV